MEHDIIIISPENNVGTRDEVELGPISRALLNASFKRKLAASMIAPLRRNIDYQGIARRVFVVDQLPQGALPIYDKDIK